MGDARPAPWRRGRASTAYAEETSVDLDLRPEPHPRRGSRPAPRRCPARRASRSPRRRRRGSSACSTWPCGDQDQGLGGARRARACSTCWEVSECSQDSRSGPATRTTGRCERSTVARAGQPATAARGTGRRSARRRRRRAGRPRPRPDGHSSGLVMTAQPGAARRRSRSGPRQCRSRAAGQQVHHEVVGDLDVGLGDGAAVAADEVQVVAARRPGGRSARRGPRWAWRHQAELLEQLEGAVDGRDVDAVGGPLHLARRSRPACRGRGRVTASSTSWRCGVSR